MDFLVETLAGHPGGTFLLGLTFGMLLASIARMLDARDRRKNA